MRTVVETVTRMREQGVRSTLLGSLDDFTRWALEHRREIARVAAADGTVTIFFSDIENSTSLNSELGDEQWVKLLASHDRLLHTYVDKHRGMIVKSQGDGYMVVFSTPELALGASLDIQRALSAKGNAVVTCGVRRSGCGSGCTPARRSSARATTSAATSPWRPGSPRWPTAARSW